MVTAYDVPANDLIGLAKEELKKNEALKPPEWAAFAKSGAHKERPPLQDDFWYIRSASVLRKLYVHDHVGVSRFRTEYGGKKNRGSRPEEHRMASGNIIRKILQQLEKAGYVKQSKKGRVLTPAGVKFIDSIAFQVSKAKPVEKVEVPKEKPKKEKAEEKKEEKPEEKPKEEKPEKKAPEAPKEEKPAEKPKEEPKQEPAKEEKPPEEPKEEKPAEEPTEKPTEEEGEKTEKPEEATGEVIVKLLKSPLRRKNRLKNQKKSPTRRRWKKRSRNQREKKNHLRRNKHDEKRDIQNRRR